MLFQENRIGCIILEEGMDIFIVRPKMDTKWPKMTTFRPKMNAKTTIFGRNTFRIQNNIAAKDR
jgi:hypothetical protein